MYPVLPFPLPVFRLISSVLFRQQDLFHVLAAYSMYNQVVFLIFERFLSMELDGWLGWSTVWLMVWVVRWLDLVGSLVDWLCG